MDHRDDTKPATTRLRTDGLEPRSGVTVVAADLTLEQAKEFMRLMDYAGWVLQELDTETIRKAAIKAARETGCNKG